MDQKHRRRSEEKTEKGDSSVWVKNTKGAVKKRQRKATVLCGSKTQKAQRRKDRERRQFCVGQKHRRRSEEKTKKGDSSDVGQKHRRRSEEKTKKGDSSDVGQKRRERESCTRERRRPANLFTNFLLLVEEQFMAVFHQRVQSSFQQLHGVLSTHTHTRTASTDVTSCDIICTFL